MSSSNQLLNDQTIKLELKLYGFYSILLFEKNASNGYWNKLEFSDLKCSLCTLHKIWAHLLTLLLNTTFCKNPHVLGKFILIVAKRGEKI